MSNSGSLSAINKIHINNSTKMTLSDRFTGFSAQPKIHPRTSPRYDMPDNNITDRAASIANRRLLKQLAQKHTREAALKLKRRSMKPRLPPTAAYTRVANGVPLKRGSVKALRLGPNGRLMKANSITNVATMEADFLGPPTRRSNSVSRVAERIGGRSLEMSGNNGGGGGRSRRISRPVWRGNSSQLPQPPPMPRMRSRSRSRTRRLNPAAMAMSQNSQSGIAQRLARVGRSNSRSRLRTRAVNRSRSRSTRNRLMQMMNSRAGGTTETAVPIKSRLGRRPSATAPKRSRSVSRGGAGGRRPRRDGVVSGRIQKRRNSLRPVTTGGGGNSIQNRISRTRGRYTTPQRSAQPAYQRLNTQFLKNRNNATRGRARSRSRTGNRSTTTPRSNGTIQPQIRQSTRGRGVGVRGTNRRGRSRQRGATRGVQRSNNGPNGQQQEQPQQRRGRSRSRRRGVSRGGRQLGKDKPEVKREDLDKELDQYMSSTKTEL